MMWPYYGDGASWTSWLWMTVMMVLFWGAIVFAVVWITRAVTAPRPGSDEAMTTLRKRFAAGEITQDEFEKARKLLQG